MHERLGHSLHPFAKCLVTTDMIVSIAHLPVPSTRICAVRGLFATDDAQTQVPPNLGAYIAIIPPTLYDSIPKQSQDSVSRFWI